MRDQLENIDDDDEMLSQTVQLNCETGRGVRGFYDNKPGGLFSKVFHVLKAFFVQEMLNCIKIPFAQRVRGYFNCATN